MRLRTLPKTVLLFPVWVLQLATSAKSFLDNPIIGSPRLNRLGLHLARVRLAVALCQFRRWRLARHVRADWRAAFDRDGFVAIPGLLPEAEFTGLRQAILDYNGAAREMVQGDAITRRLAIDPQMLAAIPALRTLLTRKDIRSLFHYVASFRTEPLHYVQTIVTHVPPEAAQPNGDPQEALHADAFHSSLKAWFFLNEVKPDEAPFTFVPGSHRFTPRRLAWEHRRSMVPPAQLDRLTARGSPRVLPVELEAMDLPPARALSVPANTLVVADTVGFHARGLSVRSTERVEIWSYARRNPFLPFIGGDILSLPGIAERRINWVWALRDRFAPLFGQPWGAVGLRKPTNDAVSS